MPLESKTFTSGRWSPCGAAMITSSAGPAVRADFPPRRAKDSSTAAARFTRPAPSCPEYDGFCASTLSAVWVSIS